MQENQMGCWLTYNFTNSLMFSSSSDLTKPYMTEALSLHVYEFQSFLIIYQTYAEISQVKVICCGRFCSLFQEVPPALEWFKFFIQNKCKLSLRHSLGHLWVQPAKDKITWNISKATRCTCRRKSLTDWTWQSWHLKCQLAKYVNRWFLKTQTL